MRIVVSGFEPFGGKKSNQSQQLAIALARRLGIPRRTLPVRFASLEAAVQRVVDERPDAWLMLGESSRAEGLVLERTARNAVDARIPDNDGAQPRGARVAHGPPRRLTSVDVKALAKELAALEIPAVLSDDAGQYACNAAYYFALLKLPPERVLFVHVPADPARAPRKKLLEGLELAAKALRSGSRSAPRAAASSASRRSRRSSRPPRR